MVNSALPAVKTQIPPTMIDATIEMANFPSKIARHMVSLASIIVLNKSVD